MPSYDIVDQVSKIINFESAMEGVKDANRMALATLEATIALLPTDFYKQVEEEAVDMIWLISELDPMEMQSHREAFQSTFPTQLVPEGCNRDTFSQDCNSCHHPMAKNKCCGTVRYCGILCQKKDRKKHRRSCTRT